MGETYLREIPPRLGMSCNVSLFLHTTISCDSTDFFIFFFSILDNYYHVCMIGKVVRERKENRMCGCYCLFYFLLEGMNGGEIDMVIMGWD